MDRAYTARGQLEEVKYNSDVIDTRVYDAGGRLIQSTYGNNVITTHTYQDDNVTSGIEIRDGSQSLIDMFTFTWDANQNKTAEIAIGRDGKLGVLYRCQWLRCQ